MTPLPIPLLVRRRYEDASPLVAIGIEDDQFICVDADGAVIWPGVSTVWVLRPAYPEDFPEKPKPPPLTMGIPLQNAPF